MAEVVTPEKQIAQLKIDITQKDTQINTLASEKQNLTDTLAQKVTQINTLTTQNKELTSAQSQRDAQINNLKQEVSNLASEKKNLADTLAQKDTQINTQTTQNQELTSAQSQRDEQINNLKQEVSNLVSEKQNLADTLAQNQQNLATLTKENEELTSAQSQRDAQINTLKQENAIQLQKNEQLINAQNENNQQIDELKKEVSKFSQQQRSIKWYENVSNTSYDLEFQFSNLKEIANGFKIIDNQEDSLVKQKAQILGVLGPQKSGKTKLISKLLGEDVNLPQGICNYTSGINVKSQKYFEKLVHYIDVGGWGSFCGENNNTTSGYNFFNKDNVREQEKYDDFVINLVISLSDVVVIVCDKMMRNQYEYLQKIKNLMQFYIKSGEKQLFIVENYKDIDNSANLEKLYHDTYKNEEDRYIPLIQKQEDDQYLVNGYLEYSYSDHNPIVHLLIALENSEAGNLYNESSINFIKNKINDNMSIKKNIEIKQLIEDFVSQNISNYFQLVPNSDKIEKFQLIPKPKSNHLKKNLVGSKEITQGQQIIETNSSETCESQKNLENSVQVSQEEEQKQQSQEDEVQIVNNQDQRILQDSYYCPQLCEALSNSENSNDYQIPNYEIIDTERDICMIIDLSGFNQDVKIIDSNKKQEHTNYSQFIVFKAYPQNSNNLVISIQAQRQQELPHRKQQGKRSGEDIWEVQNQTTPDGDSKKNDLLQKNYKLTVTLSKNREQIQGSSRNIQYLNGQLFISYNYKQEEYY